MERKNLKKLLQSGKKPLNCFVLLKMLQANNYRCSKLSLLAMVTNRRKEIIKKGYCNLGTAHELYFCPTGVCVECFVYMSSG